MCVCARAEMASMVAWSCVASAMMIRRLHVPLLRRENIKGKKEEEPR